MNKFLEGKTKHLFKLFFFNPEMTLLVHVTVENIHSLNVFSFLNEKRWLFIHYVNSATDNTNKQLVCYMFLNFTNATFGSDQYHG